MNELEKWIKQNLNESETPVFVGFNVGFDWSFINYYFHKYLGRNPFGFTSLDIKSLYMGAFGGNWSDTKSSKIIERLRPSIDGNHNITRCIISSRIISSNFKKNCTLNVL